MMAGAEDVVALVRRGHNVIVTGQCGTGKTHLLKRIIKDELFNRKIALTATTGMASLELGGNATTLHHWSGIMDGRYNQEKLKELFDNDDSFADAKGRILATEILIIDEISMLSAKVLQMVEFVCRYVKKKDQVFGGIQLIASGDFKQLPPVPNYRLNDDGKYCFESEIFTKTFPHHINLTKVMRQHEDDLIAAVNELCNGAPSQQTLELMKTLDRPIQNINEGDEVIRLYGTNFDASFVNHEMLDQMEGQSQVFKAQDEGMLNMLRGNAVPKTLILKKGAPVILMKNIGNRLYNGMRGQVHKLSKGQPPVVNFGGRLVTMSVVKFEIYDARQQKILASRSQIPLALAFALTVHRAQGQTIRNVEVTVIHFLRQDKWEWP